MKINMKHNIVPIFLGIFLIFSFAIPPVRAEEFSSENTGSLYGTITSIVSIENHYVISLLSSENIPYTFQADASTACLYLGRLTSLNQIQSGSQALFSYTGQTINSIMLLSMVSSDQNIASSVYGMYYSSTPDALYITLPGGKMQTFSLTSNVLYYVNDSQVIYSDFFRLSLPGDDIKVYLNSQNEVVKIESYVINDHDVAKTNPALLE